MTGERLENFPGNTNIKALYRQHLKEFSDAKSDYIDHYNALIIQFQQLCSKEGFANLSSQFIEEDIKLKKEVSALAPVAIKSIDGLFKKAWALVDSYKMDTSASENKEGARKLFKQLIGLHPYAAQGLAHCAKKEVEAALLESIGWKLDVREGTGLLGDLELLSRYQNMRDVNLLLRSVQYYRNKFNESKNPIMIYNAIHIGTMMPKCQEGTLLLNQIASLNILSNGKFQDSPYWVQERQSFTDKQICYKFMNLCRNQENWGIQNGILFFASQLKSFLKHPKFQPKVSLDALSLYLKFNYITAPHSIYENFYKVRPGCIIIIDHQLNVKETPFWQLSDFIEPEGFSPSMSEKECVETLEVLLKDSVQKRMLSDVPIGAFLSGGVDSSLIVSLMQSLSTKPVNTFSIGFTEDSYDEAKYAKAVANHLGTNHHELYLAPNQAFDIIPNLSDFYDEPFADASQIPTYLVARQAREELTVCLSGDGGDELFYGYDRYLISQKLYAFHRFLPHCIRSSLAKGIEHITPSQWKKILAYMPKKFQYSQISEKAYKLSETLNSLTPIDFFQSFVSIWNNPSEILKPKGSWASDMYSSEIMSTITTPETLMPYFDMKTFLPECVLTKVDRASMALGLEVRTPFLDYRIAEFSCKVPMHYKIKDGKTKAPLRKILSKYVPNSFIDRPKMGFSVPIGEWLRGDLREWAENYLTEKALDQSGFFNPEGIRQKWQDHLSEKTNAQYQLWGILMFQQWAEKNHASI